MAETNIIKGVWWLPDSPENRLLGEISYSSVGGARISLFDYFFKDWTTDRFTVWGTTVKGQQISLFNCITGKVTTHLPGTRNSEIESTFGVIGGHYKTPDDLKFFKVTAELSHLLEWTGTTGINAVMLSSGHGCQITHEVPPEISLGTTSELNMSLEFGGGLLSELGRYTMSETCTFTLSAQVATSYDIFSEVIQRFQHFVALGVPYPVYALSINGYDDNPEQSPDSKRCPKPCEIIRRLSFANDAKDKCSSHEMQFCLGDLKPSATDYIKCYFDRYHLLEPVCDLYFSTRYNSDMYVFQRFLALAHAVEAFHRVFIGGKYQSDDEYKPLWKTLFDSVPQTIDANFRASLKNKFRYLNEFSLRKRLQDICERFGLPLKPLLGEPSQFAGEISELRNLLTHRDPTDENRPEIPKNTAIWVKCEQLSLLLEVCLLHELGFSEQSIVALLPRNRRIRAIQINRK